MNLLNLVNTTCDRCGKKTVILNEIKSIYQIHEMKELCEKCGNESSGFISYYGKKKQKDLRKLRDYFNSGRLILNKYNSLMNAGYF